MPTTGYSGRCALAMLNRKIRGRHQGKHLKPLPYARVYSDSRDMICPCPPKSDRNGLTGLVVSGGTFWLPRRGLLATMEVVGVWPSW